MTGKSSSILIGVLVYIIVGLLLQFIASGSQVAGAFLGCLFPLACAMVAVWHYTSNNNLTIPAGEGAGMGALVGLIGAIIGGILALVLVSMGVLPDPMDAAMENMRAQGLNEEQIEQAMGFAGSMTGVFGIIIGTVFGAVLGAVGGAIGASVFKKGGDAPVV